MEGQRTKPVLQSKIRDTTIAISGIKLLQIRALKLKFQIDQHSINSKQRHTPRNLKEEAEINPLICSHHHIFDGCKKRMD